MHLVNCLLGEVVAEHILGVGLRVTERVRESKREGERAKQANRDALHGGE